MEQLNYRFLNYKHYNSFLNDLNDEKIRLDSIVFIQDKPCIWARGKEYVCDGPNIADIQNGTFTFKNGKDEIIFSASLKDGVMTLTDGNGNVVSLEYVLKDWFDNATRTINRSILSNINSINSLNDNYINLARDKQNKLIPGENIRIKNNVISAVVDADLYIITQSLDGIKNPNPNKIYLLETVDQDDKVIYQQYKYQDGEWISVGVADTNINMSEYLEQEYRYLQENYQPKGDYANKAWVEDTFVKKTSVYTPQDGISNGGSESSGGTEGSTEGSTGSASKMVTLTTEQYQSLVNKGLIDENTYYFTYEGEVETNWTFGGTFPVILGGSSIGEFPITLT